ncbi:ECF transporter S component [Fictibacillus aquaticus]|uniref:ECF transporter S component n=1 Tax=Fictibacillus aquaticus TaxID=2021314 RepID=UPI00197A9B0F|nr:ECF transporter S component [Fictibacillus aquaticus]
MKILTLLGVLSALLTVGRIAFTSIPNVQPNTSILIIASFVLGPVYGFVLAVISTITTNMFLGSGIWSIGQIAAWGSIALFSGWLGKHRNIFPFWALVLYAGFCGYYFGIVMTLFNAIAVDHIWAYYLAGISFDTNHAIGNMIFYGVLAKPLYIIMDKQMRKYNAADIY